MDLKKRVEKLEKARSSADPQPPVPSQQFEVRELTIEEWNELIREVLPGKPPPQI
jgi:hypothetical protein